MKEKPDSSPTGCQPLFKVMLTITSWDPQGLFSIILLQITSRKKAILPYLVKTSFHCKTVKLLLVSVM